MVRYCPSQYADVAACGEVCRTVPELGGYSATLQNASGDPMFGSGDSIECRLWHLSSATQLPVPHCAHAAGALPCQ
jgi:hypothetical protein